MPVVLQVQHIVGAPDRIRTDDSSLATGLLCPVELQGREGIKTACGLQPMRRFI